MAQEHVDVVEDFSYDSENESYNRSFQLWRRHTKAPYIYRFSGNVNEKVYVDGGANIRYGQNTVERDALMRCGELIGAALLIFLTAELAGGSLLIGLLRLFGINIRMDFLSLSMSGNQWARVAVRVIVAFFKYLIPTVLLIRLCKLPRAVASPLRFGGVPEMLAAIGAGMVIAGIYALTAQEEGIEMSQTLFTYKDTAAVASYALFETLIASALAELFLRGTVLPLLRQFGDPFAVAATALAAMLFPNTVPCRISEMLLGLCAGYLMIRSGSLAKCIVMRAVYTGLCYARFVAVYSTGRMMLWEYTLLMIACGILAVAFFVLQRKDKVWMHNTKTALTDAQKCAALSQTVTMLPWLAVSVLLTILHFQLFTRM